MTCYPVWKYIGEPYLLPGPSSGRLIVYYDGSWGTVCKDGFSVNDARVVCSELRQPTASKYKLHGLYKCITDPIQVQGYTEIISLEEVKVIYIIAM